MEHRYSTRIPANFNVLIYRNGIPMINCRMRNIGLEGIYIDAGTATYPRHSMLDVEIEVATGKRLRIRGFVIHSTPSGTGLMICGPNRDNLKDLWQAQQSRRPRSSTQRPPRPAAAGVTWSGPRP